MDSLERDLWNQKFNRVACFIIELHLNLSLHFGLFILKGLLCLEYQIRQPFWRQGYGGPLYTDAWTAAPHAYRQAYLNL